MTLLLWSAVTGPSQWWRGGWAEPAGCCHGGFLDVVTRGEFGGCTRVGPGSLSAAAAAWDELAAELWLAAASFESVCSGLADRWWQGPSSRMMAAQAARHTGWLAAAATQAEGAASQAQTMALAYEAAFAATVHRRWSRRTAPSWPGWRGRMCSGRTPRRLRPPRPSTSRCGLRMLSRC